MVVEVVVLRQENLVENSRPKQLRRSASLAEIRVCSEQTLLTHVRLYERLVCSTQSRYRN